jgi:hypothetical protein
MNWINYGAPFSLSTGPSRRANEKASTGGLAFGMDSFACARNDSNCLRVLLDLGLGGLMMAGKKKNDHPEG